MTPGDEATLATHIVQCADCSATFDRERELVSAFAGHQQQPDAALLASCRAGLIDALDRQEETSWLVRTFGSWIPSNWLSPEPAWSAAVLLVIGFSVGVLGPRFLLRQKAELPSTNSADISVPASVMSNIDNSSRQVGSGPSKLDFHTADVAGMNVLPSIGDNPAQVQLQFKSEEPVTVQGTVNDADVKGVLLHILGANEAFCPDMRLQAVDLLRMRNNDPEVRAGSLPRGAWRSTTQQSG